MLKNNRVLVHSIDDDDDDCGGINKSVSKSNASVNVNRAVVSVNHNASGLNRAIVSVNHNAKGVAKNTPINVPKNNAPINVPSNALKSTPNNASSKAPNNVPKNTPSNVPKNNVPSNALKSTPNNASSKAPNNVPKNNVPSNAPKSNASKNAPSAPAFKSRKSSIQVKPEHFNLPAPQYELRYFCCEDWEGVGYVIPKTKLSTQQLEHHREMLTVTPQANILYGSEAPDPYTIYHETEKYLVVPRLYGLVNFGPYLQNENNFLKMNHTLKITHEPLGKAKDDPPQISAINIVFEQFGINKFLDGSNNKYLNYVPKSSLFQQASIKPKSCLVSLPCGFGKTFCALYVALTLGFKTLVLVHRENLKDVWVEDINKFIPGARIGTIQGKSCNVENTDIVIATIQSISMKLFPRSILEQFGLTIIDEAHHAAAKTFCRAFDKIYSKYILSLSATPNNSYQLGYLKNWFLGPIVVQVKRKPEDVLCNIVKYKYKKSKELFKDKQVPDVPRMVTVMCKHKLRNFRISNIAAAHLLYPSPKPNKRKILIVSERGFDLHLSEFADVLISQFKMQYAQKYNLRNNDGFTLEIYNPTKKPLKEPNKKTSHSIFTIKFKGVIVFTAGYILGGSKEHQRKLAMDCDVIITNVQTAEEGFNCPRLDTLITISLSMSHIEQLMGRVLRYHPDKNVPKFISCVDAYSVFEERCTKHIEYIRAMQYTLQIVEEDMEE